MSKLRWSRLRESTAASSAATLERPEVREGAGSDGKVNCPTCKGSGKIMGGSWDCPDCAGSGKVPADSPLLKESAFAGDLSALGDLSPLDFFGDGSLRESVALARMAEKDYSTAERVEMAKSGDAIPVRNDKGDVVGGAFPIKTRGDLDDAVQSIGRASDPAAAKAHIRKQAKKLGATAALSDAFKEGASLGDRVERLEAEIGPLRSLRESKPGQLGAVYSTPSRVKASSGEEGYRVVLIREGLGNSEDARWYTADSIREMCESGVAEGMQAFADHPDLQEEENRPERSVKQLVGHYQDVAFAESGGKGQADAVFVPLTLDEGHPTYGWVVTLAEAASRGSGPQPLCGISLYGYSAGDYGTRPDGSEGSIATLIRPSSGDIVTNAGAGGGFVRRLMESARVARLRNTNRKERPMLAADYTKKVAEATARLREADSDDARNAALASLEALKDQTIDPASSSAEVPLAEAEKTISTLRESLAAKDKTLEEKEAALRESEATLTPLLDVMAVSKAVREAGVTDDVEVRKFIQDAQKLGLREAADVKAMVETERAYQAKQLKAFEDRLAESEKERDFEIEGAFARLPESGDGNRAEAARNVLRESGVPLKKKAAA